MKIDRSKLVEFSTILGRPEKLGVAGTRSMKFSSATFGFAFSRASAFARKTREACKELRINEEAAESLNSTLTRRKKKCNPEFPRFS